MTLASWRSRSHAGSETKSIGRSSRLGLALSAGGAHRMRIICVSHNPARSDARSVTNLRFRFVGVITENFIAEAMNVHFGVRLKLIQLMLLNSFGSNPIK